MDPNACIQRIRDAVEDDDKDEALAALEDLWDWIDKGGFKPAKISFLPPADANPFGELVDSTLRKIMDKEIELGFRIPLSVLGSMPISGDNYNAALIDRAIYKLWD